MPYYRAHPTHSQNHSRYATLALAGLLLAYLAFTHFHPSLALAAPASTRHDATPKTVALSAPTDRQQTIYWAEFKGNSPPNTTTNQPATSQRRDCLAHSAGQLMRYIYTANRNPDYLRNVGVLLASNPTYVIFRSLIESHIAPDIHLNSLPDFFLSYPPVTDRGTILLAATKHNTPNASTFPKALWLRTLLSSETEALLLHKGCINAIALQTKIETLLWQRRLQPAADLARLLPQKSRQPLLNKIASLRTRLQTPVTTQTATQLPKNDLAYLYFSERSLKDDQFQGLFDGFKPNSHHADWWPLILRAVRGKMAQQQWQGALRLLRENAAAGQSHPEYHWLRGFIALRFTNQLNEAIASLGAMYRLATNPSSKAQAAYWLALAYRQAAQTTATPSSGSRSSSAPTSSQATKTTHALQTKKHLQLAASHGANFYSYLAALDIRPQQRLSFARHKLHYATHTGLKPLTQPIADAVFLAELLWKAKHYGDAERICIWLVKQGLAPATIQAISTHWVAHQQYSLLVRLHSRLQKLGYGVMPISHPQPFTLPPPYQHSPALYFGIILQESSFHHMTRSKADAIGLMQVKAKFAPNPQLIEKDQKAGKIGSNLRYGIDYIDGLIAEFDQHIVPAIAAYNAGPTRVASWQQWTARFGGPNPKPSPAALAEAIELIPYHETRAYVKKVLGATWNYHFFYHNQRPVSDILNLY